MDDQTLTALMLQAVETELQNAVNQAFGPACGELRQMLAAHMGWEGAGAGPQARGKRLRPLLVLLSAAACGSPWHAALPAAAAVELLHNFSLIHDDIQDNSPLRRGRPTVWVTWGMPQAINAGDAMFSLSQVVLLRLAQTVSPQAAIQAADLFNRTCIRLTEGQYLDIAFEKRQNITLTDYQMMISGKTAALLAACCGLGAIAAGASPAIQTEMQTFGQEVGLAFQIIDDILGIWGDEQQTGKSHQSDLVSGKKTLPVLYALEQKGAFYEQWQVGPVTPAHVPAMISLLDACGARAYAEASARTHSQAALAALDAAIPQKNPAANTLLAMTNNLLFRHS
ncbi:MAG TPA: polyprenyl synthetase family protein [Anaerolineaceae bacterium]|nr:polyprenyl synthetase family protein [Anaerolineaceae bacterium]HPN53088.1 polyprenyl synthetase family protein [Anaerolineaceae bacterium]